MSEHTRANIFTRYTHLNIKYHIHLIRFILTPCRLLLFTSCFFVCRLAFGLRARFFHPARLLVFLFAPLLINDRRTFRIYSDRMCQMIKKKPEQIGHQQHHHRRSSEQRAVQTRRLNRESTIIYIDG